MKTVPLKSDTQHRLYSLDVLRGFDMFWITGGEYIAIILAQMTGWVWLGSQMDHVEWSGFHFYDLIFPLFMFISGVAIPFAIESKREKSIPQKKLVRKAFVRFLILVFLGIMYNGALQHGFTNARFASVLGQIGFGYFFASLIIIYTRSTRTRLFWLAGILIFVSLLQLLYPVPGVGSGVLTPEGCVNGYFDRMLMPGKLYRDIFDPEGLLCNVSAIGITLMGTFAGNILRKKQEGDWKKITRLAIIGTALIVVGLVASIWYPVIKSAWTTTFNLVAGGISFLLLALFFLVVDHWKVRKWTFYFRVIGLNSIFVYLFVRIVDIESVSKFFTGWLAKLLSEQAGQLVVGVGALSIIWGVLYFLYKKGVFVRI
jgi:predicted acyltransferase